MVFLWAVGTRRTLSELRKAVLGWGPPGGPPGGPPWGPHERKSSKSLNRRPLDGDMLLQVADEAFALLLIERRLRQHHLLPKNILGGSGVHALLFGKP